MADLPFFLIDEGGVRIGRAAPADDPDTALAWEITKAADDAALVCAAEAITELLPVGATINPMIVDDWGAAIAKAAELPKGTAAILCSSPVGHDVTPAQLVEALEKSGQPWVVDLAADSATPVVKAWGWSIAGLHGRRFLSSMAPPADGRFQAVRAPDGTERVDKCAKTTRRLQLLRKDDLGEQRLVYGIVLEPEVVDSQNDIYSAAEIARAAHGWMEDFQNMGHMHQTLVNQGMRPVESYVAPCDFEMGGQQVKAGTWILVAHVLSDAIWSQIKAGELTGWSIGGMAQRVPAQQIDGNPVEG